MKAVVFHGVGDIRLDDEAFQGYEAQLARLEVEPGVRQQL